MLRSSLYEAALVVLTGPGRWNPLKAWASQWPLALLEALEKSTPYRWLVLK